MLTVVVDLDRRLVTLFAAIRWHGLTLLGRKELLHDTSVELATHDGGSPMKITFSIFVAAALLLGSSSAEAARGIMLPPTSPSTSAPLIPQTNPIGGAGTGQSFGALPGAPGSPTYDPNAALPSLNNQGSALAPLAGPTASGQPPGTTTGPCT